MAKVYLSMKTPEAALVRVLSFKRGIPIAEFSVGRRGTWRTNGLAIADRHLWVSFDGECVVLRRDSSGDPVSVNGRPLQLSPERIVRLPCRVEFGGAKLVVDDRKPPVAALDAGVLSRAEPTFVADTEPSSTAMLYTQMFDIRMFSDLEAKWGAAARADSNVSKPAAKERIVADGCATSVMPLEVLLQRGLAGAGQPEDRRSERRRRRRLRQSRAREGVANASRQSRLRRWFAMLLDQRALAPRQKRVLALGLLVPGLALLSNGLLPGASGATPEGTSPEGSSFHESATAGTEDELLGAAAPLRFGGTNDAKPRIALGALHHSAASPGGSGAALLDTTAPAPAKASRATNDDEASEATSERQAVDALAASDKARARALYASLARRAPDNAAFAEAARILGVQVNGAASVALSAHGSNVREEGVPNGQRAAAR